MSEQRTGLDGAVAIVTGAGSGIGKASAHALAAAGARLVVTELPEKLGLAEQTVSELVEQRGGDAVAIPLDVRDLTMIASCTEAATAFGNGRIDILVNNAGINIQQMAFDVTEEAWDNVLGVNLKGLFFMSQAVGRQMRDQSPQGGSIVNIASQMGVVGYWKRAAYCSSKAGVVNLTRVLCFEWASSNIRVNAIGPTFVDTPLTRPMFEDPEFRAEVLNRIPLGRLATPEDVADAVVFLAGPGARSITGHTLLVDGGWTAV